MTPNHIAHMKTAHFVHILILFTIGLFGCTRCNYKTIPDSTWVEIKDGEMVDSYVRRGDNIYFNIFDFYGIKSDTYDSICLERQEPISIDAAHFSVCKGTGYARDLEYVYYPPANISSSDGMTPNESECDEFYLMECIVEHAIPKDFKYVKDGYGIDRWNMFRYGSQIEWDDSIFETE